MMWRRRLAVVALSSCACTSIGLGCGLIESFDGYSDKFDGGARPSEDGSIALDGREGDAHSDDTGGGDSGLGPDSVGVDSTGIDSTKIDAPGTDAPCDPTACAASKGPLAVCGGTTCICPTGTVDCGGKCTHPDRDPLNCGGCGRPVPDGAHWCVGDASTCRPGTDPCEEWDAGPYHVTCTNSASCTDFSSDGSHCFEVATSILRRCYLKDPSTGVGPDGRCIGGKCTSLACPAPDYKDCPSTIGGVFSCFNIKNDSNNCGSCFNKCKSTQVCIEGGCTDYVGVKSCTECATTVAMTKCCTGWAIPICVPTGSSCPLTPGS